MPGMILCSVDETGLDRLHSEWLRAVSDTASIRQKRTYTERGYPFDRPY